MQLKAFLTDDRAVPPVVGVILMVAVTVILASIVGTFVLGVGSGQQTTPSASFDYDFDGGPTDQLTITYVGGDDLSTTNSNSIRVAPSASVSCSGSTSLGWLAQAGDEIVAGDEFVLTEAGTLPAGSGVGCATGSDDFDGGEEVRVVWEAPNGGKTQVIGTFTIPS